MKNYLNFETEIKNLEIELDKLKIHIIKKDYQKLIQTKYFKFTK